MEAFRNVFSVIVVTIFTPFYFALKGALNASDPVSGYAGIPRNMTGIAQKLKDVGYVDSFNAHLLGEESVTLKPLY